MGVIRRSVILTASGTVDRLDAEYFDPDTIALEDRLRAAGASQLRSLGAISDVRVRDPRESGAGEFQYLEISDVDPLDGFAIPKTVGNASASPRARVKLTEGDVVMSSVRPARNAVFLVAEDQSKALASTGFIVLRARRVPSEVLFASLKAPATVAQLARRGRASMYPALHPPDVLDVRLPSLNFEVTSRVVRLVQEAVAARASYLVALGAAQKAADGFFAAGAPGILQQDLSKAQARPVLKSALFASGRLDSEFHARAFSAAHGRLRGMATCKTLAQLCVRADTGRTPASDEYSDGGPGKVAVLKVAALTNRGLNWPALDFADASKFGGHPDSSVQDGDIVLTSSAHSAPHIARKVDVVRDIPSDLSGQVTFAGELMRLRLKNDQLFPPEYVAAFLRSPLGGEQVRRCTRGITSHIYPGDVLRNVLIPEPTRSLADAVRDHAAAAHNARWEYRLKVVEAVSEVQAATERLLGAGGVLT